jgi:hypothetical protein
MKIELSDKEAEFLMRALVSNHAEDNQDFEQDISDSGICSLLIDKLIQANGKMYQAFNEARQSRYGDKERIKNYLFMGSGWHSIVSRNKLIKRIIWATSVLGGMEQNGGMGTEFDNESDKQDKQTIKEVALDVLTALGLTVNDLK